MKILPKMPPSPGPTHPLAGGSAAKDAKLRKAAQQMEGAFVEQMYKSMRETVPTDGAFNGGSGEEMFTGLLDQHVASDTPMKWQHGLSESIYRQMSNAIKQQSAAGAAHEAGAAATADQMATK